MIDEIANRITNYIKRNTKNISEEKAEIINYGMNILIYQSLIILAIFTFAVILGLTKYISIAVVIFAILRVFAGGAHANSRIECAVMNFTTLFGTVVISKYLWAESWIPAIALYAINVIIVCIYAPGDTVQKPIISPKRKMLQKIISILIVIALFIFTLFTWKNDRVLYNIFLICPFLTLLILTPIGYKLFKCKHSFGDPLTHY